MCPPYILASHKPSFIISQFIRKYFVTALLYTNIIKLVPVGSAAFPQHHSVPARLPAKIKSAARPRYDTRHGVLILFSLETYNLYSIASQRKHLFDPKTIGISPPVLRVKRCLISFQ